jgi:hypothetical protein
MATRAFDTKLKTIGQVLAGPWRAPVNMLLEQSYDNHVSLHDDAMAQKLGFKAGPIEGPTHYSQFVPLAEAIWGERFLTEGCLSAHYRNMVMEGEEVRAFIEREPGEDHAMYQAWSIVWGRAALAGIAELIGVELPGLPTYTLTPTLRAPAFDALVHKLGALRDAAPDEGRRYELDQPYRLALALQRADALGPAFDAIERDEIAALLGRRVEDLAEANAQLEQLVLASGPERDAEILR